MAVNFKWEYIVFLFFFLAGFAHQLLYLLFPLFALQAVFGHHFEVKVNQVTTLFLHMFLFMLMLYFVQAFLLNELPLFSAKGVARYFSYFCLALFLSYLSVDQIKRAILRITQLFMLLLPYGIIEVFLKDRYVLVFGHSNHLAYALLLLVVYALNSSFPRKWWYYLGLAFSILLTKSSGATLGMLLITFLHLFFVEELPLKNRIILSLLVFSSIALVFSLFPERVLEQWDSFAGIDAKEIVFRAQKHWFGSHGSGVWRVTYWIAILTEFFKSPPSTIVFGLGLDSMTQGHYAYRFMNIDPHNDYIRLFTETGIVGMLFFSYFVGSIVQIVKGQGLWIIALLLPMYFGNILVSFAYMVLFIILLTYKQKVDQENEVAKMPSISKGLTTYIRLS